jgi:flavin-dependent dehydrogenase
MIDVFVIGGGPAGLATAIAARRRGLRVAVADALTPPIDKACGEGLMPDALHALGRLGVSIPAEQSFPFRGIRLVNGAESVAGPFPNGHGLGIRRTALHAALAEQAEMEGAHLLWGATVTGISAGSVEVNGVKHRPQWIVGADGGNSRVRKWIGLEPARRVSARVGFRRHYRIAPWSECMEIHWGNGCQIYITPVSSSEVCVALISLDPTLRLAAALRGFPQLAQQLAGAQTITAERGAVTASRRLLRVHRGNVALVGDASGSVDAITGEGLRLAFVEALALADAMGTNRLGAYASLHGRLRRRPAFMARFMLMLGESPALRRRVIRALSRRPDLFADLLALHIGAANPLKFAAMGAALGAGMLTV